jgi:hypothetical protein
MHGPGHPQGVEFHSEQGEVPNPQVLEARPGHADQAIVERPQKLPRPSPSSRPHSYCHNRKGRYRTELESDDNIREPVREVREIEMRDLVNLKMLKSVA